MRPISDPSWVRLRPVDSARDVLLCLPHAGGGTAIFRGVGDSLPVGVDVYGLRAPGRESRLREEPIRDMSRLLDQLREQVNALGTLPLSLFGYCSGALVGFELARLLASEGRVVRNLFVAGCPAPSRVVREDRVHAMDRDQLKDYLRVLGLIPDTVLDDPQLMSLFEPAVRADYELFERSPYRAAPPLPCSITAFAGTTDPSTDPDSIANWHQETESDFSMHLYPGDHTFFTTRRPSILATIATHLAPSAHPGPAPMRSRL